MTHFWHSVSNSNFEHDLRNAINTILRNTSTNSNTTPLNTDIDKKESF